jgi:hypothetical protein
MSRYALELEGYEDYSVWGYDDLDDTYFAQLWRNESRGDGNPVTLNWFTRKAPISSAVMLATLISVCTETRLPVVMRAMGAAKTSPDSEELLDLARRVATAPH